MRRSAVFATSLSLVLWLAAIVGACTSFSSPPLEDAGAAEASTASEAGAKVSDTGAPPITDGGAGDADGATLGDGAPRACSPACPSGAVCDDGTCLLSPCAGDGGVVLLRPKALVDTTGSLSVHPANVTADAVLRERGDGDGDGTYVEGLVGPGATLKLASELFRLPPDRDIHSVYIRARSRRTDPASSASIGLLYWFPSSGNSVLGRTAPTPVGTGYGIASFFLEVPYIIGAPAWTESIVNDVQVGVGMNGAPGNAPDAGVRLTQVWVEVCLKGR